MGEEMELAGTCNRGIEVFCRDWGWKDGTSIRQEVSESETFRALY